MTSVRVKDLTGKGLKILPVKELDLVGERLMILLVKRLHRQFCGSIMVLEERQKPSGLNVTL